MVKQVLAPTVEHGEEANLSTQVLGIGGDGAQGLSGGPEQNAVDHFLILVGYRGNLFRQRKDHVKILGVEKFGATIFKPFRAGESLTFRAVAVRARNGDLSITCVMGSIC